MGGACKREREREHQAAARQAGNTPDGADCSMIAGAGMSAAVPQRHVEHRHGAEQGGEPRNKNSRHFIANCMQLHTWLQADIPSRWCVSPSFLVLWQGRTSECKRGSRCKEV